MASRPIRNRATIAGNIVNASPAGDLSVMCLALDATLIVAKGWSKRTVALRDFFRGYKVLDLVFDEMIAEIRIPIPAAGTPLRLREGRPPRAPGHRRRQLGYSAGASGTA